MLDFFLLLLLLLLLAGRLFVDCRAIRDEDLCVRCLISLGKEGVVFMIMTPDSNLRHKIKDVSNELRR